MFYSYTKKQAILLPHVTDEETEALRSYNQPTVSHQALHQTTWLQAKILQQTHCSQGAWHIETAQ